MDCLSNLENSPEMLLIKNWAFFFPSNYAVETHVAQMLLPSEHALHDYIIFDIKLSEKDNSIDVS